MPETDPTTTTDSEALTGRADEIVLALARSRATTSEEFEAVDRFSDRARAADRDDLDLVWQLAVRARSQEEVHRRAVAAMASHLNSIGIWTEPPNPWRVGTNAWRGDILTAVKAIQAQLVTLVARIDQADINRAEADLLQLEALRPVRDERHDREVG